MLLILKSSFYDCTGFCGSECVGLVPHYGLREDDSQIFRNYLHVYCFDIGFSSCYSLAEGDRGKVEEEVKTVGLAFCSKVGTVAFKPVGFIGLSQGVAGCKTHDMSHCFSGSRSSGPSNWLEIVLEAEYWVSFRHLWAVAWSRRWVWLLFS